MSANGATAAPAATSPAGVKATGELATAQFAQGFEGMATAPFGEDQRKVLGETPEHDDVEIKPDGICFMPGVWYRRKLTKAFGAGGWALAPRSPVRTQGDVTTYHGALYVLGRWVAEAIGECENQWMSPATRTESARTDCLTRCCKDLCMASELWDKTWREDWMRKNAESYDSPSKKDKFGKPKKEWRLKARRAAQSADLGLDEAPATPADLPLVRAESPARPKETGTARAPSAGSPAKDTTATAPAGDTGEAASVEAYAAIAAQFKRLSFTKGNARKFLGDLFGVQAHSALTAIQADSAHVLLMAWGTPAYDKALAFLRGEGRVRS